MRNLRPIVQSTTRDMKVRQAKFPKCRRIRPQFIGNNLIGNVPLLLQEFSHNFKGCALVPARLRQDLENLAFIVNRAPQICPLATNSDKNLIKTPGSRRLNSAGSDVGGDCRTELQDPTADRFIADIDPAFGQHFLDVAKAQRKAKVEPDGSLDYRWRKSVACVGNHSHSTTNTGRQADRRVNVTMPLVMPVTGVITNVNPETFVDPGRVSDDLTGFGWLFEIDTQDPSELQGPWDEAEYLAASGD